MKNYNLLKELYEIHSPSNGEKKMRRFVAQVCTKLGAEVTTDHNGNLLVVKGESDTYPCVVAHLDQVQERHAKDFRVVKIDDTIIGYSPKKHEQQGLGADDKNGIWVALEMLEQFDVIKCAFFVGEEIGCEGSSRVNMDFFKDVRFVLQADRRGANDLITNIGGKLCSDDFLAVTDYKEYGYKEKGGLLTDVLELSERGVGVSCLNISCGYYDPHTDHESTSWKELCNCRDFIAHIIEKCGDNVYPHNYEDSWGGCNGYYNPTNSKYDADYTTMYDLLDVLQDATFDEIESCYGDFFYTKGNQLRSIYENCKCELSAYSDFMGDGSNMEEAEETLGKGKNLLT